MEGPHELTFIELHAQDTDVMNDVFLREQEESHGSEGDSTMPRMPRRRRTYRGDAREDPVP